MKEKEKAQKLAENLAKALCEILLFNSEQVGPKEPECSHREIAGLAGTTTKTVIRWINDGLLIGKKESARIYSVKWTDWERFALARKLDPDGDN